MTAAVVAVATWISSSRGIKVSSPTNSVSKASRGLCRNVWHRDSSARWSVTYCVAGLGVTGLSFGWIVGGVRCPWRLDIAEAQIFFQKLVGLQHAAQFRFGAAVAVVRIGMELFGLVTERRGDFGERT